MSPATIVFDMIKLEIITPEKKVFDGSVDYVTIPTASGEAGILPNHAPLVSALKPGILTYSSTSASDRLAIGGGFVEVNSNVVSILADSAQTAGEIDVQSARDEREAAEAALSAAPLASVEEHEAIREEIEAAQAKISLASGRR